MKRLIVLILIAAMACLAFAADAQKPANDASGLPQGVKAVGAPIAEVAPVLTNESTLDEILAFESLKTRYYELLNRAVLGMATTAELTELNDLSATMGWEAFSEESRAEEGSLDQGSTDTVANCASATVIPSVPYSDTGVLDGDNDCSISAASPYNEVFYTFTPSVSGFYFLRAARTGATAAVAAIRVVGTACCADGASLAFSSGTVATDCGEPSSRVTYLRADLVAGTQYWIHVGTSSSTAGIVEAYDFSIIKSPDCPPDESATAHSTCATAQFLAIGDSVLADSASDALGHDWYQIELAEGDSIRIDVYGRAVGSCLSGLYPGVSGAFVDARFSFWSSCSGLAGDSLGGDDVGSHGIVTCSEDAAQAFCLNPGVYYIKVRNFGAQQYIIKTTSLGPCTTAPIDCATLSPCGSPAEVEPNNVCADAANILPLECGITSYGILCPGGERDYWYVPATTGTLQTTVLLSDGDNCSTFPPTILGLRLATTAAGLCTTPSGSFAAGFIFGGCTPWPGGWIAVDRAVAAGQSLYSLTVSCGELQCACPVFEGPNHGQACASCLGEFPEPGTLAGSVSFFQTVIPQYQIIDLDVCVAITHTYTGDIDMFLVTPWNDTLELTTDNGSSGDNMYVTTFDDEAATSITVGVAPFNGSFIPEEPLAGADGYDASGTWELICGDDAGGDSGYVHCWCLNITYDVILSVELSSFSAVAGDGSVTLNWATASEADNDHFVIERDGAELAEVAATNNETGSTYSWTDNGVANGTPYEYSLYAVDVNGSREFLGSVEATPEGNALVTEYALHQNYPNPFNPTTNIAFDLVEAGQVSISVFNVMGQKVADLVNGQMNAGRHVVSFDAAGLSSGLYLYKMEANGFSAQNKMLLLK